MFIVIAECTQKRRLVFVVERDPTNWTLEEMTKHIEKKWGFPIFYQLTSFYAFPDDDGYPYFI